MLSWVAFLANRSGRRKGTSRRKAEGKRLGPIGAPGRRGLGARARGGRWSPPSGKATRDAAAPRKGPARPRRAAAAPAPGAGAAGLGGRPWGPPSPAAPRPSSSSSSSSSSGAPPAALPPLPGGGRPLPGAAPAPLGGPARPPPARRPPGDPPPEAGGRLRPGSAHGGIPAVVSPHRPPPPLPEAPTLHPWVQQPS